MPTGDFPDPEGMVWTDAAGWVPSSSPVLLCPACRANEDEIKRLRAARVRYARYQGPMDEAERERICRHPLCQYGDTVLAWVNEGDLCFLGESTDAIAANEIEQLERMRAENNRLKALVRSMGGDPR